MIDHLAGVVAGSGGLWSASCLRAYLWVVGDGPAPVTGRPGQPVTGAVAEVEWWSALAAIRSDTAGRAPLREISAEAGVVFRPPGVVGAVVADATWTALTWLLGLQDPDAEHGLVPWLFHGPTPTASEVFKEATAVDTAHGARRSADHWAGVYAWAEGVAARYRRMAARMREVERLAGRDA